MSEDKRELHRRHIRSYMSVHTVEGRQLLGQLVDITQKGLLVITENPIEKGWQAELKIKLSTILDGDTEIFFNACCVWCEPDINPRFYAVGFEIEEISSRSRKLIQLLIKKYGLRLLSESESNSDQFPDD
ncbi:MAG: PilZ domain-containing protein [Anaerolineales bacterium]|nr:PilZ domain-containing protein [Anaerolineales bacterium]